MSVNSTPSSSTTATVSQRLERAIAASGSKRPDTASSSDSPSAPKPATRTPRPSGDAARGAKGAPDAAMTGANAAEDGAGELRTSPYTPYEASSDAYVAQQAAAGGGGQDVRGVGSTAPAGASGAWDGSWQQRFERLQLAPADIEYLATGGFDAATLEQYARELEQVPTLEAGRDAGSVASADGPLPQDVMPAGQPGAAMGGNAWTPQWEQRFGELMERMGMPASEIKAQLEDVKSQPVTEEQLQTAYTQMEAAAGDFDAQWREKFSTLMDELKTPAKDKDQALQQLASSGLTEAQLQDAYSQMQAQKPAWNEEWENKFKSLQLPEELLKQLKESGAPKAALEEQFQKLLDTKMEYKNDGRLKKLEDAKATPEEKWGVMLEGKEGKEFDKLVEQIHSSHVSGWKRLGSFALNLIPGVYAVQYLTGKDWVTGEKIDRSNPLNIVGAVASGFAGFTAVRGAIQGVQGLSAANAAFRAGTASSGLRQAVTSANLLPKFQSGLKAMDYIKAATPIVNRFGEAGRLSAVGRGYFQSMQLASGMAALRAVEGGGLAIDKATKANVLGSLKQGGSIDDALQLAGRSGRSGGFAVDASHVARDFNRYGFLQGNVNGRFGIGNGSGNFTFNPFKNTRTISTTADANVFSLGRGVNFGTNGGLAMGMGAVRGANMAGIQNAGQAINAGLASQAAARMSNSNQLVTGGGAISQRIAGMGGIADDAQRVASIEKTAEFANKLGVAGGSKFRTLLQLGNNRQAASIASVVENGGSRGYRAARIAGDMARKYGGYVALPTVAGATVGMPFGAGQMGRQMQPAWDYYKNRGEIQEQERAAAQQAEQEAAELERIYAEHYGTGGAGTAGAGDAVEGAATSSQMAPGATAPAPAPEAPAPAAPAPMPGVDAGSATGGAAATGGVFVDPQTGFYVDPTSGLMADPATGNVYDPRSGQVVANLNAQGGGAAGMQQPAA